MLLRSLIFTSMMSYLTRRLAGRCLYSNIKLTINHEQQAAFLTLANDKKRNPLALVTIKEIQDALKQVEARVQTDKIKTLVLNGEGTVFSAGHDLKEIKAASRPQDIFEECTKMLLALKRMPIITLCSINGVAAAAGFQMALTCDLVVATEKSTFSTPGVKWGLFCSTPGVQLIRSITSEKKANEMLLFGQPITAQQAFQYGLVNKVVPNDKLDQAVSAYIAKANDLSGEVVTLGKRVLNKQSSLELEEAYAVATEAMCENILEKEDCREGLAAFAEKRHPHFKN